VAVDERGERPEVLLSHATHPLFFREDVLNHEGVDVDECNLKEMEAEDGNILVYIRNRATLAAAREYTNSSY
jgi:hypothetical protein